LFSNLKLILIQMALLETFEKQGQFLFRWRGHIPIIFIFLAIPVLYFEMDYFNRITNEINTLLFVIALVFAFLGHFFRALTVGKRHLQSSGRNRSHQVAAQLNTTDMYSITRHPLYFGNFLIWLALVIYLGHLWFGVLVLLSYLWYYEKIMFTEENFLRNKFGQTYLDWSKNVPTFFPKFLNYKSSGKYWSWRIAAKNEYPGLISTMTTFWFITFLKFYVIHHTFLLSKNLLFTAGLIFLFGVLNKTLKHYSSIYNEDD
jgi:protein-S-isoprenylcysteine O-methyltransferase Ste14